MLWFILKCRRYSSLILSLWSLGVLYLLLAVGSNTDSSTKHLVVLFAFSFSSSLSCMFLLSSSYLCMNPGRQRFIYNFLLCFFILIGISFCRPAVLVSSQPPSTRPTGNETLAQILDRSAKYDFGSLQPNVGLQLQHKLQLWPQLQCNLRLWP